MDQAVSLLTSIYDVYKTIKDGQDQFHATYTRMKDLLHQFQTMQDGDTLVQSRLLDKYVVVARDFLKYLDKYKKRKFFSKVIHQSDMLAEIEGFNQELEALFQLYHLAMGSHIVEHNRAQEATMDELVRGMRVLLQGSMGGHALKTEQSSDDLLASAQLQSSGPVATAQVNGDVAALLALLVDDTDAKQVEQATQALFELAEEEATRDAIVQAGGVPTLIQLLRTNTRAPITVTVAKTLRRLAVRDVHEVAIVEAGGMDALSVMLLATTSTDEQTTAACAALANLVFQAEHKRMLLKTHGMIARLVALVRSGSSSQKKHAANTLRELAASDDCASAINQTGGITALVDVLHIGTPELCASALAALWNLSSLEKNRTEIAAVGGINAIVAQIRRGATDDQRQLAASALAVLAQDDANDAHIGAAGGVELLVTLLQTGTDGQKNSAAWALAELANDSENASAMLRAGVAPALMAAFRSGSDIQRAKAGLALVWIAELADDISTLADEIGVSSIVSLLRGSADQRQHAASIIASMAEHEEAYQTKLGEVGAIELLVELAKKYSPKTAAMKALCALASDNETNQEKIGDAGGIEAIVSVLSKLQYGDDAAEDGDVVAFEALAAVAQTSVLRQVVIDAGGVSVVLKALAHGDIVQKRSAASLLADLVEELSDEDDCDDFNACAEAFTTVFASSQDASDDVLRTSVLNGLMSVTLRANGCAAFVNQARGVSILLGLLQQVDSDELRVDVGYVFANIATHEEHRVMLGDAGVLEFFNSSLNAKDENVQIMAAYGFSQLSASKDMCQRMMDTRGLCRRIVKLLDSAATDNAKERISETIWNLSTHPVIAGELGQVHGLDELVTFVQEGTDLQTYNAMMAMACLSAVTENIEVLTEIGAIEAAVTVLEDQESEDKEDVRLASLQMLSNMASNREAAERMTGANVVAQCVAALHSEEAEWKQYGLTILEHLNHLDTSEDTEDSSDIEDEEEENDDGFDEEEEEEEGDEEEGEEGEEEEDTSVVAQIRDAGGIEPLMEMLEDSECANHAAIIKLLDALASDDESSKRKIGACLSVLIESVREGSDEEQEAAASAIVTLVDGSKRNTATAIRARVADAFMKLLDTSLDAESIASRFDGLLSAIKATKSTESTAAVKKITTGLVKLAAEDSDKRGEAATAVLEGLLGSSSLAKAVLDAGAPSTFADVITGALKDGQNIHTPQMKHAASILAAIVESKYAAKLFNLGVIDELLAVFNDAPAETRCAIATIVDGAARNAPDERDAMVSCADVLVEMLRHGTVDEKVASAGTIAAMTYDTMSIFEKMPQAELLDACLPLLNASDEISQYQGLRLVASLASIEAFGPQVVSSKPLLQRTVDLLMDDGFEYKVYAVWAVEELVNHTEGRTFLVDAGADKRLNQMAQDEADHEQIPDSCMRALSKLAAPAH